MTARRADLGPPASAEGRHSKRWIYPCYICDLPEPGYRTTMNVAGKPMRTIWLAPDSHARPAGRRDHRPDPSAARAGDRAADPARRGGARDPRHAGARRAADRRDGGLRHGARGRRGPVRRGDRTRRRGRSPRPGRPRSISPGRSPRCAARWPICRPRFASPPRSIAPPRSPRRMSRSTARSASTAWR